MKNVKQVVAAVMGVTLTPSVALAAEPSSLGPLSGIWDMGVGFITKWIIPLLVPNQESVVTGIFSAMGVVLTALIFIGGKRRQAVMQKLSAVVIFPVVLGIIFSIALMIPTTLWNLIPAVLRMILPSWLEWLVTPIQWVLALFLLWKAITGIFGILQKGFGIVQQIFMSAIGISKKVWNGTAHAGWALPGALFLSGGLHSPTIWGKEYWWIPAILGSIVGLAAIFLRKGGFAAFLADLEGEKYEITSWKCRRNTVQRRKGKILKDEQDNPIYGPCGHKNPMNQNICQKCLSSRTWKCEQSDCETQEGIPETATACPTCKNSRPRLKLGQDPQSPLRVVPSQNDSQGGNHPQTSTGAADKQRRAPFTPNAARLAWRKEKRRIFSKNRTSV